MFTRSRTLAAGLMAVSLLSLPALAAGPRDGGARDGVDRPNRAERMEMHRQRACADAPAWLAGWLGFAETKLGITATQRTAWDNFARELRASQGPMQALCNTQPQPAKAEGTVPVKPDPVERLRGQEARLSAELESVKLRRGAIEQLLPQLSAEQRDRFAELPPMVMLGRPGPHGGPQGGPHRAPGR